MADIRRLLRRGIPSVMRHSHYFRRGIVPDIGGSHFDAIKDSYYVPAGSRDNSGGVFCASLCETGLVHAE